MILRRCWSQGFLVAALRILLLRAPDQRCVLRLRPLVKSTPRVTAARAGVAAMQPRRLAILLARPSELLITTEGDISTAVENAGALAPLRNVELSRASTASEIWSQAQEHAASFVIRWNGLKVKSHATDKDYQEGASVSWSIANEVADILADRAADSLAVSDAKTQDV